MVSLGGTVGMLGCSQMLQFWMSGLRLQLTEGVAFVEPGLSDIGCGFKVRLSACQCKDS